MRPGRAAEIGLVGLTVAAGLALAVSGLYYTWLYHIPVPFWDQYDGARYEPSEYTLSYLLSQHNEHRLAFPRLLFLLDLVAFGGRNVFLSAVTLTLQAVQGLILFAVVRRTGALARRWQIGLAALALGCLLAPVQLENFIWGFQVQFAMVVFFATATFAALGRCADRGRDAGARVWLAAAAAAATVATYSLASGLLVWPIAVVLALWLRLPWRQVGALAVCGLVVCGLFLFGWHPHPGHSDPLESLASLPGVLGYAATYLGGPFAGLLARLGGDSGTADPLAAVRLARLVGGAGLLAALGLGLLAALRRRALRPAEGVLLAIAAFPVGTALATGLGRLLFPAQQALASRYSTPALVFWVALALTTFSIAARTAGRATAPLRWGSRLLPVVLAGALLLAGTPAVRYFAGRSAAISEAAMAMVVGVDDHPRLASLYPDPGRIWPVAESLRRHRWSLFAEPWPHLLERPFTEVLSVHAPTLCSGGIESLEPVPSPSRPGLRVTGRARDEETGKPPERVVLVGADGRIRGFGAGTRSGDGAAPAPWTGYAAGSSPGPLRAYALRADGEAACPLGGAVAP